MIRPVFDYVPRAFLHRPSDRPTLRAAAFELLARGLKPQDIASALGISEAAVRQLIGSEP